MDPRRQRVKAWLASYASRDAEEAEHLAAMRRLLAQAPDPFDRNRYAPGHFTASALVLCPERRSLLLILHAKLQRWLQPGGHIDPHDPDPEAAARREVQEESGIASLEALCPGLFHVDVHAIPARPREPAHHHYDLRFAFVAGHRQVRPASDAQDVRWVPLQALDGLESDASVRRAAHALQAFTA